MIDQRRICQAFARAAAGFDTADFLHREIRERLLTRLLAIAATPALILDLGAGTGGATVGLHERFPAARILSVDLSPPMLAAGGARQAVCADAARLPLTDRCVDLIYSNLMLQHCPDPVTVLGEARRVLADTGLMLFTTLGRASFIELGRAWATADRHTHITPFVDIQELGDLLAASGFIEPVLDSQTLTVTYDSLDRLMHDLRNTGSTNATSHRNAGLTGRDAWRRLAAAYDHQRDKDGKLPVTIEVIFGLAWAGPRGGDVEIPIGQIGRMRRGAI